MHTGKIAVAVGCMDCRLHHGDQQMTQKMGTALGADHVYVRTVAGPEGKILPGNYHCDAIIDDVALIVRAKGATIVGVIGHYDCAGHPVSNEQHDVDVVRAAQIVADKLGLDVEVVPLVAIQEGGNWVLKSLNGEEARLAA